MKANTKIAELAKPINMLFPERFQLDEMQVRYVKLPLLAFLKISTLTPTVPNFEQIHLMLSTWSTSPSTNFKAAPTE